MPDSSFSTLLDMPRVLCRAHCTSKKKSLQLVAQLIEGSLGLVDDDEGVDMDVMDALAARERLGCTGMGHGIAMPHGRVDFIEKPVGALITLDEPVDFDAPDGEPVDIVFGLLMPEDQADEHLAILAALARFFNSADNRSAIRNCETAEEILDLILLADKGPPDVAQTPLSAQAHQGR